MYLADVLKYPPVPSNLARCHVEATLKFPCCSLGGANWIDTLFRGRSHNSPAKKASCSELAPAYLKKWQKNQIWTPKKASNLKPFGFKFEAVFGFNHQKIKAPSPKIEAKIGFKKVVLFDARNFKCWTSFTSLLLRASCPK